MQVLERNPFEYGGCGIELIPSADPARIDLPEERASLLEQDPALSREQHLFAAFCEKAGRRSAFTNRELAC
jgi:hypothetical protein